MVFASHVFLYFFLPCFLGIYYLLPNLKLKNIFIILASYLFYAWGTPQLVLLLLISSCVNYFLSLYLIPPESATRTSIEPLTRIEQSLSPSNTERRRYHLLTLGVVLNLAVLGYYKYSNFFIAETNEMLSHFGLEPFIWTAVILPAGISFFTFQKISYLVDVYRGTASIASSLLDYFLFVILFPQLIAGPIVRYHDIATQIRNRPVNLDELNYGLYRFAVGLGKKVLIADQMGFVVENVFSQSVDKLTLPTAWLGIFCYALQIYFDFSGYSDMAIGLGRMMGFKFLENFHTPYISQSITEFWRRWHISLSNFMKEYVYLPLGGNRISPMRTYLNLWLVFLVSGIWHGANWTFICWGSFHGILLTLDRLILFRLQERLPRIFNIALTFLLVTLGWVLFRSPSLEYALDYYQVLFNPNLIHNQLAWYASGDIIHNRGLCLLLAASLITFLPAWSKADLIVSRNLVDKVGNFEASGRFFLAAFCYIFSLLQLSSSRFSPFLYFNF